jgi:hypothetical protein
MKHILLIISILSVAFTAGAQDFNSNVQTARQSYNSGDLENSRFAMQQMLQELDIISGKETLKILPSTLGDMAAKTAEDAVSAGSGFAGAVIHRIYQTDNRTATMEIISNSPLVASVNAILAIPFIGTGGNSDRMVIRVEGYKALVQKKSEANSESYEIQIPLGSTLISVKTENYKNDITRLANEIPVGQIAQKLN